VSYFMNRHSPAPSPKIASASKWYITCGPRTHRRPLELT